MARVRYGARTEDEAAARARSARLPGVRSTGIVTVHLRQRYDAPLHVLDGPPEGGVRDGAA